MLSKEKILKDLNALKELLDDISNFESATIKMLRHGTVRTLNQMISFHSDDNPREIITPESLFYEIRQTSQFLNKCSVYETGREWFREILAIMAGYGSEHVGNSDHQRLQKILSQQFPLF